MFTEFEFPKLFTDLLGLQPARLRGLQQMVVLAGPNGAGKSRYLRLVAEVVRASRPDVLKAQEAGIVGSLGIPITEWSQLDSRAARKLFRSTSPPGPSWFKVISLNYEFEGYDMDPLTLPPMEVSSRAESTREGGFSRALAGMRAYVHTVAKVLCDAYNPQLMERPVVREALEDAKAFNRVLQALLAAEVGFSVTGGGEIVALFRGRRFVPEELSMGELVLVGWAIILHRQRAWLSGACVLVDEPENHLHTDVCIRALDALRRDILGPEGQIWLATHSVPLIAHAGIESVHLVDHGAIEYAGNKTEKVLERLLGGQEGRAKLRTLMADADELAFDNFAAQCLLPPGVASAQEDDPQQLQMVRAASILGTGQENIHLLDFAAGRGRLAAALKSAGLMANRRFTYHAFQDPDFSDPQDRGECLLHIQSLGQPQASETYLVDTLEGFTVRDAEKMDLVVMCNVLHEIPVGNWQRDFERIHEVLAKDGHLVILEDQLPSVGELPHANGYVILNEPALQHLFDSKDAVIRVSMEKGGRLTAFAIPRRFLKKVTPETIGRALASIRRMAEDRILHVRNKRRGERSFQDGRQHAHFTLLYANAQLASHQFPDPDKRSESLPAD